jgi:hypothetical protein
MTLFFAKTAASGWNLNVAILIANFARTDQKEQKMVDYDYVVFLKSNGGGWFREISPNPVRKPLAIPEGLEREKLAQDPYRMCQTAFSRKEKLPDDLHQAMIMWSFHPEFSFCTKYYLEFLEFLDSISDEGKKTFFGQFKAQLKKLFDFRKS